MGGQERSVPSGEHRLAVILSRVGIGYLSMSETFQPPGWTERVRAASVLVLAPHYDDEVLGCGGLIAGLAPAVVRVLFLTDSSGGAEDVADREAYGRRRREEAAKVCEILGIAGCDHLGL